MSFPFIRPYPFQNIDRRAGQVFECLKLHYDTPIERQAELEWSRKHRVAILNILVRSSFGF